MKTHEITFTLGRTLEREECIELVLVADGDTLRKSHIEKIRKHVRSRYKKGTPISSDVTMRTLTGYDVRIALNWSYDVFILANDNLTFWTRK